MYMYNKMVFLKIEIIFVICYFLISLFRSKILVMIFNQKVSDDQMSNVYGFSTGLLYNTICCTMLPL